MNDDIREGFFSKYNRQLKEATVIAGLTLFLLLFWKLPPYQEFLNRLSRPVVKGIMTVYSHASTFLFQTTGIDLGLVNPPPDSEFMFQVQMATYINERKAGPLLDIAMNTRVSLTHRETAIKSLLKFDYPPDWIQPFINELSKGGLIELDQHSPVLNSLFEKIREEGGIRNPLLRAYAEVVFSFMLQSVRDEVRLKSLGWVSDVMAEDAVFLLVPRLSREEAEPLRAEIDQALLDIRAISDSERAKEQLIPFFNRPRWPGLKFPLGIILARLGYDKAIMYVQNLNKTNAFTREQELPLRVALAGTSYPKELKITNKAELLVRNRISTRKLQYALALKKQQEIWREQKLLEVATAAKEVKPAPLPPKLAQLMQEKVEAEAPKVIPIIKTEEKPAKKPVKTAAAPPPKIAQKPVLATQEVIPEAVPEEVPPQEPVSRSTPRKEIQVASLPKETVPETAPPLPAEMPGTKMKGVDIFFEVKKQDVPLYMNPGNDHPTGEKLAVGSKGKADFEVLIDEERWLQVKSRDKVGWINGALVSAYNLTPDLGGIGKAGSAGAPPSYMDQGRREEATYFEPLGEGVKVFFEAKIKAKPIGVLKEGNIYLALASEKVGPDRWFQLELEDKTKGWVQGVDLRLADIVQAKIKKAAEETAAGPQSKSAFAAEWVVAGVKGVLVYDTPELSSKHLKKISPPIVYKVTESLENEFGEWYRIGLGGKEGWVQAMDVNLTKPSSN
ncbi:MAG: hypothetical protein LHV69_09155 [Elusimicrobia bacterium]|nr:hypothetical protein [Candidatus Obscuribacterium magneticum]